MKKPCTCLFKVQPQYFKAIKNGKKKVEGRIAKGKYLLLKPGDKIKFVSDKDVLESKVEEILIFSTFGQMIDHFGLKSCLPMAKSVQEGIAIYYSFADYKNEEKKHGVIGIKFSC